MPPSLGKNLFSWAQSIELLPISGSETVLIHHRHKLWDLLEITTLLVAVSSKVLTRTELVSVYTAVISF
jgi:hypothetical protein